MPTVPTVPTKSSTSDLKERIPVYPLDVYVVTERGEAELKGGSTALTPKQLELLVLIDGRANVEEIVKGARSLTGEEVTGMLRQLIADELVKSATIAQADGIDFRYFFEPGGPAAEPSAQAKENAEKEAQVGTPHLQQHGYYVSIARRAARPRQLEKGSTVSVLMIEDDQHLAKFLRQILGMEGLAVRWAKNREEIVVELRRLPSCDLVLLDVTLPDANGFDILQSMKQHPQLKAIPVVMLTAQDKRDSVMRGLAGGADGYMTKPLEVETLIKGIKAVLGLT